jgi:hypothetical protein
MAYETKPETGAIFKNDKREKDSQPHGKGSCLIDGVAYWISAWTNDGPKGKYQSLKFERKDAAKEQPLQRGAKPDHFDAADDSCPF